MKMVRSPRTGRISEKRRFALQKPCAEKEALFTSVPVGRAILSLAVPTVLSQIITVVYNMADTFFIGQLGDPNQVAAATIAMPLISRAGTFSGQSASAPRRPFSIPHSRI